MRGRVPCSGRTPSIEDDSRRRDRIVPTLVAHQERGLPDRTGPRNIGGG